jgi:hypothetical protein
MNANDETFHFPLSRQLGNGRASIWCAGPDRAAYCHKAISQGRGGARLLSIPAGTNGSHARSPTGLDSLAPAVFEAVNRYMKLPSAGLLESGFPHARKGNTAACALHNSFSDLGAKPQQGANCLADDTGRPNNARVAPPSHSVVGKAGRPVWSR